MKRLLFFGELPTGSVHGISVANQINLDLLGPYFEIGIVQERKKMTEHDRFASGKMLSLFSNYYSIFKKSLFRRFDYFYLTYSLSASGSVKTLAAILVFRIFNRGKVVLHLHRGDFFSRFYNTAFNKLITRIVFSLSHKILVLSEEQKNVFESFFKRPFLVLPNTIEAEYGSPPAKRRKGKFIYISNYLVDKGIIDLLDVFSDVMKEYPGVSLATYGEFPDHELKAEIEGYACERIVINPPVTGTAKFKEIAGSGCLVLPSWSEGQPIVILEAMSVATPVIASAVGLIPELLGDDYPYLALPRDRESLKQKIVSFIKSGNDEISEYLYERYQQSYSRDKHFEILKYIFE